MRSFYSYFLALCAALLVSCGRDAVLDNEGLYNAEDMMPKPSSRTVPMTWNAWFPLDSTDSIIPGTSRRDSSYACADTSSWWPYVVYTPVYQSREAFSSRIGALSSTVPLLNPGKLMVFDNHTYVTDVNRGVHIYDYGDVANPREVAFIAIPGVLDLALKNHTLLANAYSALVAIDVSVPSEAKLLSLLPNAFPPVYVAGSPIMDSLGNVAVAWQSDTVWQCGYVYDIGVYDDVRIPENGSSGSQDSSPVLLGKNASLSRFAISSQWLYAVDYSSLRLFAIGDEDQPSLGPVMETGAWDLETVFKEDSVLYLGAMSGMHIYTHDEVAPPIKASTYTHITSCDPVVVRKGIAYVTLSSGNRCGGGADQLEIVDVTNPYMPVALSTTPMPSPQGLAVEDSTLVVCQGENGFSLYDIQKPEEPSLLAQITDITPTDVIASQGILTFIGEAGVWRYSFEDRSQPQWLSTSPAQ